MSIKKTADFEENSASDKYIICENYLNCSSRGKIPNPQENKDCGKCLKVRRILKMQMEMLVLYDTNSTINAKAEQPRLIITAIST